MSLGRISVTCSSTSSGVSSRSVGKTFFVLADLEIPPPLGPPDDAAADFLTTTFFAPTAVLGRATGFGSLDPPFRMFFRDCELEEINLKQENFSKVRFY